MKGIIQSAFIDSAKIRQEFVKQYEGDIIEIADIIAKAFSDDKKLLLFGNGGSAADAQHIAAEFVNRFKIERPPLPAIALTTDTSILTSIGNDYDFAEIFVKQIKALSIEGDIAIGISTSGNSPNVIKAFEACQRIGVTTILFTGGDGGNAHDLVDYSFVAPTDDTPRIQEIHITLGHVLCELIDYKLFQGAVT